MNDIAGTIEANRARNDQWLAALKEESARKPSAYKELREIRDREDYDRASRRMQQRDNIEAAIGATPEGGRLSDAQVKSLNEMRGVKIGGDGLSEGQIVGGGYNTETGGYEFVIAGKNPDGTIAPQKTEIPETELYGMMRNRPDWFTPEHIESVERSIWGKDKSYTRDRFEGLSKRYVAHRSAIQGDIDRTKEAMRIGRNGGGSGYGTAGMEKDSKIDKYRLSAMKDWLNQAQYKGSYIDGKFMPDYSKPKKLSPDERRIVSQRKAMYDALLWGDTKKNTAPYKTPAPASAKEAVNADKAQRRMGRVAVKTPEQTGGGGKTPEGKQGTAAVNEKDVVTQSMKENEMKRRRKNAVDYDKNVSSVRERAIYRMDKNYQQ